MKFNNTKQQVKSTLVKKNNSMQNLAHQCKAGDAKNNMKSLALQCITIVSVSAILALLCIFILEKNENLTCIKSGLVQKIDNGKIIWVKPQS